MAALMQVNPLPIMGASQREMQLVFDTLIDFAQLTTWRNVFAGHWEEVADLIYPSQRNTFFYGNWNWPGRKTTQQQVDATGMMALHKFAAICDSLLTPRNQIWHQLEADDDYVMKDRQTRLWFEKVTKILFKYRYAPQGNFTSQNHQLFQQLGAFGTGIMFTDVFDGPERGLRYRNIHTGEFFAKENHQGLVNGGIRWWRMTAQQIAHKWRWTADLEMVKERLERQSLMPFNILHRVVERDNWQPDRWDHQGMKFSSHYVLVEAKRLLQPEGGYRSFPYAVSRYDQGPGEVYGRSPAMNVLPSLKTLNAQKRVFLKSGHRAADPPLLTADDGLTDFSMRPGALNKGGVTMDGKPLVHAFPTGQIQITKEQMEAEAEIIKDAFLVTLFQVLTETPTMTATEVIERTTEKGILLAPTVGRQQSEYLGPHIHREIDLLAQQGLLPPMPPRLREARGSYNVRYTSPLARAAQAQEAAGFMRTVESVKEIAQITQDSSVFDPFDFDTAVPAIAAIQGVPESWMSSPDDIAQKRKQRQQAMAKQQAINAAPAQAAMMKAQAAQAKAGMGGPQPGAPQQQEAA